MNFTPRLGHFGTALLLAMLATAASRRAEEIRS
jgi:hypothetical protein